MTVYLNDGHANFTEKQSLNVGLDPLAVVIGDCNGDGKLDLVVSNWSKNGGLLVFSGNGAGSFTATTSLVLPANARPAGLAIGDVNGDGLPDLLVADSQNDQVAWFQAKVGGGHLAAQTLKAGVFPISVTTGDINRDGLTDIVVCNFSDSSLTLLKRQGTGFVFSRLQLDGPPASAVITDIDRDGINDLVVTIFEHASVAIFRGQPDGTLGQEQQLGASALPYRPLIGDVNNDGRQDLLLTCTGDRMSLFLGRSDSSNIGMIGAQNYQTGIATPEFVTAADFDGSGKAQLAVAGHGSTKVSIMGLVTQPGASEPGLAEVLSVEVGRPVFTITKGDFNRDGRIDLAVACQGGVKILGNTSSAGKLVFTPIPADPNKVITPGIGPFEVCGCDMNGDGADDLVITDSAAHTVTVVRAVLPGINYETNPEPIALPGEPLGLAVADFTGDGIPDVAVALIDKGIVRILRNDGSGRLVTLFDIPVPAGPCYLRTADFNEDGKMDLVVSNSVANVVTVLLAQGNGFTSLSFAAGQAPTALLTRDLNRDGHADILVASFGSADFRVLLGDGKGGFPVQLPFPGTYRATSADLADVNGDSLPDLLIASTQTTRVSLYKNISK